MGNEIYTNPEALRQIASSIDTYAELQCEIVRKYLNEMNKHEDNIDVMSYRLILEAIGEWLKRMEDLKEQGMEFSTFLRNRADYLDEFGKR